MALGQRGRMGLLRFAAKPPLQLVSRRLWRQLDRVRSATGTAAVRAIGLIGLSGLCPD